jgi:ABC-type multidrug transport system ATPase subunit
MNLSPPHVAPVLELEKLVAGHGGRPLLGPLDLRLARGEILALHGPSGGGKTTLLRTAAGLIAPISGRVLLGGRPPEDLGWPRFRRLVPLVQQQPALLDGPVRESLERPFAYRSAAGRRFDERRAAELLDRLELPAGVLAEPARLLSVGQQQRVSLIRALLLEPAVLLLDEPTSALDGRAAGALEQLLREEARRGGLAVLVASHQVERAERWCDRSLQLVPSQSAPLPPEPLPPAPAAGGVAAASGGPA